MNVAVLGLWHLGSVTAACLAGAGHSVSGWDPDSNTVAELIAGRPPVAEPGLSDLIVTGLGTGDLRFTVDLAAAVSEADVVWCTFDTPVDDEDRADVNYVVEHLVRAFPWLREGTVVLTSSQLPVGSVARLERAFAEDARGRTISFACLPENL